MSIEIKPLSKDRVEKLFSEPIHKNEFKIRNISEFIKEPITAADFNYESPIKCIMDDMTRQLAAEFDNNVYKVIQRYNIDVDKDELVRALTYDRNQYNKGFEDGFKADKKARWINVEQGLPDDKQEVWAMDDCGHLYQDTYPWDDCGTIKWYGDGCYDVPIVKWMEKPADATTAAEMEQT